MYRGPHPAGMFIDELSEWIRMKDQEDGLPAPVGSQAGKGCPDGGKCHHNCLGQCFRVQSCGPLSGVYPGDQWPPEVKLAHVSPVRAILDAVRLALEERYGPLSSQHLREQLAFLSPPGLRVEMHPSVRRLIYTDPLAGLPHGPDGVITEIFPVPVKITMDVPEHTWRLVIVTEDVLTGGTL